MQSSRVSSYNQILVAQCHLTEFFVLRPLTSKRAVKVAQQLLDVFLLLGARAILQSDNGREFTACVIQELKSLWPRAGDGAWEATPSSESRFGGTHQWRGEEFARRLGV